MYHKMNYMVCLVCLQSGTVKVDGIPLWEIEPWEKQAQEGAWNGAGGTIPLSFDNTVKEVS